MSTYKHRYEARDDGLRFQDLVYQGNFKEMDAVPDGILGDKIMRSRAKSKVLEKVSKEDVLRDQFTLDELNDLNNYLAWNIWDVLVMRATEGVSGMIPRQEYEILAFMQEFYRWPEILEMTTNEIGAQGVSWISARAPAVRSGQRSTASMTGASAPSASAWVDAAFSRWRPSNRATSFARATRSLSSCSGCFGASGRTATSSIRRTATAAKFTRRT